MGRQAGARTSPAACGAASRSRAAWCTSRGSSSSTSRPPASIRCRAWRSGRCCRRSRRERDLTVLITTHYMDEADKLCDRIAIVDHGELMALDSPLKLKASIPGQEHRSRSSFSTRPPDWERAAASAARRRERDRRRPRVPHRVGQRPGDDHGADGSGRATPASRCSRSSVQSTTLDDVFVHYTGRGAARRAAGAVGAGQPVHDRRGDRSRHASHLGHHRARAAALPPQPDADRHVDGHADRAAGRPRLRVRRQRQAPEGRRSSIRITACRRCASASWPAPSPPARRPSTPSSTPTRGRRSSDLRNGRVNGVLTIPPDFSRRCSAQNEPRVALIEDNTDNFVSAALAGTHQRPDRGATTSRRRRRASPAQPTLDVVEVYPYVPYIQYLLPGSIVMSIFMMVMIGGGIIFIDDKARGLHEGYLVTPITKLELIAGFNISGTIKAVLAGLVLMIDRLAHRRRSESVRSDAAAAAVRRDRRHGVRADQPDVPAHGAGHRSADAARDLRRAQHRCSTSRAARSIRSRAFRAGCR